MIRGYISPLCQKVEQLERKCYDVVIVGAGIAGMTTALSLDPKLCVALVSKGSDAESSTYKAQGGIAVAVGPDDSAREHAADTLRVGQGICRDEAVNVLVAEGPAALEFLQRMGARFAAGPNGLELGREAAHSRNRVVHYFDYTGRHISETLAIAVSRRKNIERFDDGFLMDVLTAENQCCGCVIDQAGKILVLQSAAVVLATGGYSGLFGRSTNEFSASGDGIAAAYRAGAAIADMEFVQFHPTVFTTREGKAFLLTEALRGEGAVLRNLAGERFMLSYHPDAELAPRDEVSRAIRLEMARQGGKPIVLDARQLGRRFLADRFRQVYAELLKNGYSMESDEIPVAPAAHYTIGGVQTDLWGRSSTGSLYVCGEAAATGVHGANRLASNSLLEGAVFGRRIAAQINGLQDFRGQYAGGDEGEIAQSGGRAELSLLRQKIDLAAGVERSDDDLRAMFVWLKESPDWSSQRFLANRHEYHACNAGQLATLLLEAALLRQESRGTHFRTDYPQRNDEVFRTHCKQQWGKEPEMR
jgi:L-aspartate oxidase